MNEQLLPFCTEVPEEQNAFEGWMALTEKGAPPEELQAADHILWNLLGDDVQFWMNSQIRAEKRYRVLIIEEDE